MIGFATGSSPTKVFQEIIRIHKEESLSFKNVIAFNLDEYFPINKDDKNSYHHFMKENLFDHIDIPLENINIPSGEIKENQVKKYCIQYEKKIQESGGIDIQLLGIGRTGHIGFNEPGSHFNSKTRLITLDIQLDLMQVKALMELKMSLQRQLLWVLEQFLILELIMA